tara:strand:+ start:1398 stop:2009 length:612 start_codon:yes stop_codon:yes gene_type:complete
MEMAENKKSFILYCDIIHTIEKLNDDDAGKLFKHVLRYVNDLNPETDDIITQIAFEPIKQQLKRDLVKFESIIQKRSDAGKKGMESRYNKSKKDITKLTSVKSVKQDVTNLTVNDNVNVNVNVNDIKERKSAFKNKLDEYIQEYGKALIYDFFMYWSEHGDNDKKMRFEKEKTFGIKSRLNTWKNRVKGQYDNPNDKFRSAWS